RWHEGAPPISRNRASEWRGQGRGPVARLARRSRLYGPLPAARATVNRAPRSHRRAAWQQQGPWPSTNLPLGEECEAHPPPPFKKPLKNFVGVPYHPFSKT